MLCRVGVTSSLQTRYLVPGVTTQHRVGGAVIHFPRRCTMLALSLKPVLLICGILVQVPRLERGFDLRGVYARESNLIDLTESLPNIQQLPPGIP